MFRVDTLIMHQHARVANIIRMEFFNFKVVYLNGYSQFFMLNSIYIRIFSTLQFNLVPGNKPLRSNPALAMHIERMLGRAGN